jgi:hypothetical protein
MTRSRFFSFLGGAALYCALDQLHIGGGLVIYPTTFLFREPIWVPLAFGAGSFAGTLVWSRFFARGGDPRAHLTAVARAVAWVALAFLATVVLKSQPSWLVLGALVAGWLVRLRGPLFGRKLAFSLLVTAGGTLGEALLVRQSAYAFAAPEVLDVPLWLPGLYLHSALFFSSYASAFYPQSRVSTASNAPRLE